MGIHRVDPVEAKKQMIARYGENKPISDGNYDKELAVKCVNGNPDAQNLGLLDQMMALKWVHENIVILMPFINSFLYLCTIKRIFLSKRLYQNTYKIQFEQ